MISMSGTCTIDHRTKDLDTVGEPEIINNFVFIGCPPKWLKTIKRNTIATGSVIVLRYQAYDFDE